MIYAVNKRTKEHQVVRNPEMTEPGSEMDGKYGADRWLMVRADADGWIEWQGGECPLPDGQRYEVKNRDGEWGEGVIGKWVRGSHQKSFDIIAYRPILDAKPKAPEWRGPQDGNPPAGTPVSVRIKECDSAAMVLANDHNIVVVRYESGMGFKYGGFDLSDVRPIRSEEDRAVDDIAEIIDCSRSPRDNATRLYRAGYRKTSTADGEDV